MSLTIKPVGHGPTGTQAFVVLDERDRHVPRDGNSGPIIMTRREAEAVVAARRADVVPMTVERLRAALAGVDPTAAVRVVGEDDGDVFEVTVVEVRSGEDFSYMQIDGRDGDVVVELRRIG